MIGWKTYVGLRLLIRVLPLCLSVGCQPRMQVQPAASAESVRGEDLQAYLSDPRLLNRLDVKRLRVLESHGDWAVIGAHNESDPLAAR